MESGAKAELNEVERLARKARRAANDYPMGASLLMTVADLLLVGVFIAMGLSTPVIVAWILFLVVFFSAVRMRRPARPRRPWATAGSRQHLLKTIALDVAVNAVWIPLFFFARPVALGLLIAVLLWSLFGTLKYRHA